MRQVTVSLFPLVSGVGGMVSFRQKLAAGLARRGIEISDKPNDRVVDAVLIIGGTRNLWDSWRARRRGVRIVHRLNGMNWLHRVRKTGVRHYLRAEYGNMILRFIRDRLADRVIYQSEFAGRWWEREYRETKVPNSVVYNGVDLDIFKPDRAQTPPKDRVRVLLVEGSIMGGYELGLEHALELVIALSRQLGSAHSHNTIIQVELMVVGKVSRGIKDSIERRLIDSGVGDKVSIIWKGLVANEQVAQLDRSAHVLYSADINAACPNAVIESMACGTPVIAFDTGALPELVTEGSGKIVPYGGNPWNLEEPDFHTLAGEVMQLLKNRDQYSQFARDRAVATFGLDAMVDGYLEVLLG